MKDCKHIRGQLSALIDGELPQNDESLVRRHLKDCSACDSEWQQLSQLDELLQNQLTIDHWGTR